MTDALDPAANTKVWQYRRPSDHEFDGKDCRKFVTLEKDGMIWVGIRAYHAAGRYWVNGGEPELATVIAWCDLPDPARGRWSRGILVGAEKDHG